MKGYKKSIIPYIESMISQMTPLEKKSAYYFINQKDYEKDFSAETVAKELFVSKATLTRFAQKCGSSGYREFVYEFKNSLKKSENVPSDFTTLVLNSYQELLNKSYSIINEKTIFRIAKLMSEKKRVYFYGMGSSGITASETKFRFMRLGLVCEAINDSHTMRMNKVILDEDCLVIGLSISGETAEVIEGLKGAKDRGATTVLITANQGANSLAYCDEVQIFAVKDNLSRGNIISPQFPILIIIDLIYAYYMEINREQKEGIWHESYKALNIEGVRKKD